MKIQALLVAIGLMLGAAGAAAQSAKIGVVNLSRLESQSTTAKRSAEALKKEFEPRNKQIEELQKKIAAAKSRLEKAGETVPATERQAMGRELSGLMRQSDQMVLTLRDDYELRRKEFAIKIVEEARAAIKIVAEAGKFDLILHEAAFARPGIDITDQVLKEMAKRGGAR